MNLSRIQRCMNKSEEIQSKFIEEWRSKLLKFWGLQNFSTCKFRRLRIISTCKISQVANFCNLRNFAGYQFSQPANTAHLCLCACWLLFDPPFWWFYTSLPSCKFGSFKHCCNFLILSTYISSAMLVIKSTFHAINESGWHEASSPLLLVIFSSSPFTFLHFLGSQTPLDDEKSRDARLKPPDP